VIGQVDPVPAEGEGRDGVGARSGIEFVEVPTAAARQDIAAATAVQDVGA